jgi:hypothetical protein
MGRSPRSSAASRNVRRAPVTADVLRASSTARDVWCPACGARPGSKCSRTVRNSHVERTWALDDARRAARQAIERKARDANIVADPVAHAEVLVTMPHLDGYTRTVIRALLTKIAGGAT